MPKVFWVSIVFAAECYIGLASADIVTVVCDHVGIPQTRQIQIDTKARTVNGEIPEPALRFDDRTFKWGWTDRSPESVTVTRFTLERYSGELMESYVVHSPGESAADDLTGRGFWKCRPAPKKF